MKSWGRNKIKNHLKFKGISEKLINRCFDEIDEQDYENILKKIYENHYSKQKGLKEYQKKSKTITYLIGRGFEYEEIRRVMEREEEGI
jgi:regulatory protein